METWRRIPPFLNYVHHSPLASLGFDFIDLGARCFDFIKLPGEK